MTAFVNATARSSRARRTSSTDSFAAACAAVSVYPSWYAPSLSAARTGGSSFRTGRRPSVSIAWSSVRTRWTEPYASRCAKARSRSSSPSAAVRKARSAYASCSKTRRRTSYAARRAGLALATEVRVVCHPPAAGGLHFERLERTALADARLPDEQVSKPRADVRREGADAVHELLRRRARVELAIGRRDFLRVRHAILGLRCELRLVLGQDRTEKL